jgi:uncharacterized protein YkwD
MGMRKTAGPLFLVGIVALTLSGAGPAAAARPDAIDHAVVAQISQVRAERGLSPLRADGDLARGADRHSASMARTGTLTHGPFESRLRRIVPRGPIGETIAQLTGGQSALARRVVQMWMASPPHRAILLEPRLRRVGVGRQRGRGNWYVTADFAGRSG